MINVAQIGKSNHELKLGELHIEWILEVAEKDAHFSLKNLWVLHQDQVDVSCGDVLDLRRVVHQRD